MRYILATAGLRTTVRAHCAWTSLRDRLYTAARRDDGYSTETGVITALLVIIAIAVMTALGQKLMDKVNSISM
ncbi:hypothetical protein ABIA33_001416 [Streptacidiphilus sp. MAP12-16]|uniref:hypothetical protein n=1 Tax=Streptacidiphilus sp. MAP12-16 TaxID=3156300 RepID=UPI00351619B9